MHIAVEQVLKRAETAKSESDFTYFFSLLLATEAIFKLTVLGLVALIAEDKDRNRYRLEHTLVRADGLGEWGRVLEDALSGPASQFLLAEAREEQGQLLKPAKAGDWSYEAVRELKAALDLLGIDSEDLPVKSDLKRWFRYFTVLRNKTRAHGATTPQRAAEAVQNIARSIELIYRNFRLFERPWAYLHRNLSGKYRVSQVGLESTAFDSLKQLQEIAYLNGMYIYVGGPRRINLIRADAESRDFFFANGGFTSKKFEFLSYYSDDKVLGDSSDFIVPPGTLPPSETEGHGELIARGQCFSNAPEPLKGYVDRQELETELESLLLDDRRPIITLLGRGGIGKTSLALQVIQSLYKCDRFQVVVWLSARDVDLQLTGPKPVRPLVLSPDDMGRFYSELVLSRSERDVKGFDAKAFLESQLLKCDLGACLFIFDNFETTQNPVEMFGWIDSYIRLPNKALITTRLREFKGDYPLEVGGMSDSESRALIIQLGGSLGVLDYLDEQYTGELISRSGGHPYVIKILLGDIARQKRKANIPQIVASSEDILTALFERTYSALTPCAQRAFLTLSAWNSPVPRLALEAVLYRSTEERQEVERGIESLLQYSLAEIHLAPVDGQEFVSLPLVASVFGKKKLNISPSKSSIHADVDILQMLGPTRRDDVHLDLASRLENFLSKLTQRIDEGGNYEQFQPILEAICRSYNEGWLLLARWHMEQRSIDGFNCAKEELKRYLESADGASSTFEAWRMLGHACYQTGDTLGEVHSYIERCQGSLVHFYDVSNTANRLNTYIRERGVEIDREQKSDLVAKMLTVMTQRKNEASADDFSRMAWLAINSNQELVASDHVRSGLALDPENHHLVKLSQRLRFPA